MTLFPKHRIQIHSKEHILYFLIKALKVEIIIYSDNIRNAEIS